MQTLNYNQSEIRFGSLTETGFNSVLTEGRFANSKKIIITDENVFELWMEHFITSFNGLREAEIIQLPSGEENKVLEICTHVWNALSEYEISRTDLIINIGGGVITDMGGFIASTFKRGLAFINVPTTLLSQVDASVGGKTGIDLGPYKNQIGVFADPEYVFVNSQYLTSLPEIELESGYAEMLKHGLIADAGYWERLKDIDPKNNPEELLDTIYHSVKIKRDIVAQDHQESGIRKHLNFGHTIGHAIEGYALTNGQPIPHGYGVAWGMIAEAHISAALGLISTDDFAEINETISNFYPKTVVSSAAIDALKQLLLNDKKNNSGTINFTLLNAKGEACYDKVVPEDLVETAFRFVLA